MESQKRLDGKVVLVTGAGQTPGETPGNGRAAAIAFARAGARVYVTDRVRERAVETHEAIGGEGGESEPAALDVTDEAACASVAQACRARFGRIDILHHNVGIAGRDAPAHRLDQAMWDKILSINTTGLFLMTKPVIPIMRDQGAGCIIAISSIAAMWTINGAVAYKTSKAAINAFVQAIALDNAKYGIRANAILPGLMDTPIAIEALTEALGKTRDEVRARRDAMVPLRGKQGSAWDVAHAAVFLASDEASFITGVMLPVDGGQSARIG